MPSNAPHVYLEVKKTKVPAPVTNLPVVEPETPSGHVSGTLNNLIMSGFTETEKNVNTPFYI